MGIVKTARKVGLAVGTILDDEDRKLIAQAIVLVASGAFLIVALGGAIGLAVRVFGLAAG